MKNKILVSGLINFETSVKISNFPVEYSPIEYPFFGVNGCVSGVGYNIIKALKTLGSKADLLTEVGDDLHGNLIKKHLKKEKIDDNLCITFEGKETAESIVLVDGNGKRKIYCDLKDIQDRKPLEGNIVDLTEYSVAVLTNINFNRELLKEAKKAGIRIATDVHVLWNLDDEYNKDFMENADILFLSNEAILGKEGEFCGEIYKKYHNSIIVCGCGSEGALMYLGNENRYVYEKSVAPRGIESTVGAGDALFSCFIHFYNKGFSPEECLKKAVLFAGLKISASGGSNGFVSEIELSEDY